MKEHDHFPESFLITFEPAIVNISSSLYEHIENLTAHLCVTAHRLRNTDTILRHLRQVYCKLVETFHNVSECKTVDG